MAKFITVLSLKQNTLNLATDKSGQQYGLALYSLGYTQFKRKNYDDALGWLMKYVKRADESEKQMVADAYNRIGDCQFYVRGFDEARQSYAKALQLEPGLGDYSLYQEGFVKGVQRDYMGKIQSLNDLITKFPQSQYIDDALYEQGRAFIMLEDNANAIGRYQMLVKNIRKAAMRVGQPMKLVCSIIRTTSIRKRLPLIRKSSRTIRVVKKPAWPSAT